MKKDYTHVVLVLDRSGSMNSIKSVTVETLNKFVTDQSKDSGTTTFSLILFDHEYQLVKDFEDVKYIQLFNNENFIPRGRTALRDAIGKAINETGNTLARKKESERPSKVLFAIMTDGYENASTEFTQEQISEMIQHQTNTYKWEFVYLGANQDSFAVAQTFNIPTGNVMNFIASDVGVRKLSTAFSSSARGYKGDGYQAGNFFNQDKTETENVTK